MADVEYHNMGGASGWVQAGAAAGGLSLLGQFLNNGCNNGCNRNGLFGLFGNNCGGCNNGNATDFALFQQVMQLQSENAALKAENYSDKVGKEVYMQSLADNRALDAKTEQKFATVTANLNALNDYAHNQAIELARTQERLNCCCETANKAAEAVIAVDTKANANAMGINTLMSQLSCVNGKLDSITKTVVPNTSVCPGWGDYQVTPVTPGSTASATCSAFNSAR